MPPFGPRRRPRRGQPPADAAFRSKITEGFQSGQMTPTDIFAAIGTRGGRTVPGRRPPTGGPVGIPGPIGTAPGPGGVGIPGPVAAVPGPGTPVRDTRRRRRRARGAPGTAARGRSPGRENVRAKQKEFRDLIFPRGMTRARFGAEQRLLAKKEARGLRGKTRAKAEAQRRMGEKEQLQLGRVQSLQTRIGLF